MKPKGWVYHPDEVERLVAQWRADFPDVVSVAQVRQFTGRPVFSITLGAADGDTVGILFNKPHAHEPAPCAAMMNVISKLLTGRGLDGADVEIPPEQVLSHTTLTFIPDANPFGTERAPVPWWDGTQYTNEEFWVWMRGRNPETGKMWERYDRWDIRHVEPKPETIGIVYEQISEHEYVEPNRCHASSLFKLMFQALEQREYHLYVSLHQTEFVGTTRDCMVILPILYDEQPEWIQQTERRVAEKVIQRWREIGGKPVEKIEPLGYKGTQAEYLRRAFRPLAMRMPGLTSEVRNNSLLCPPSKQRGLCEAVIWAAIEWAMESL